MIPRACGAVVVHVGPWRCFSVWHRSGEVQVGMVAVVRSLGGWALMAAPPGFGEVGARVGGWWRQWHACCNAAAGLYGPISGLARPVRAWFVLLLHPVGFRRRRRRLFPPAC